MKNIKEKNMKWWVGIMLCVALFGTIMFFSYEKMCFVIKGVKIEANMELQENSPIATIEGKAPKATHLSINGREIFIDKEGNFSEKIAVLPGFSIITIRAEDRFGNAALKKFEIAREKSAEAIAFDNVNINNSNNN